MPELPIEEIADAVKGNILNRDQCANNRFIHFHFDTRSITSGNTLFFALKSETRDGHLFVPQLENQEGTAAVVSRGFNAASVTLPLIQVDDPLKAAHRLASHVRDKYRHIKYVGVTGSAGKTTTKEFVYQLLSHKYRAFRSSRNWNNWIGMPFSILNMKGDEEVAVFELAMSSPGIGEIDLLAGILRPDAAVILNAFPVHLEFLKTVENVAQAKSEILNHLAADDIAFINGDLKQLREKTRSKKGRKIYFGCHTNTHINDIILEEIIRCEKETTMVIDFFGIEARFVTPFINRVHIENLFTAIIIAQHLGMKNVEIQEALKEVTPLPGRGVVKQQKGFTIIDETYNSNPEALKKTLDWVNREYKGTKIAILGDMLELGENEESFHKDVGHFFASLGFDRLITVGRRALKIAEGAAAAGFNTRKIRSVDSSAEAGRFLKEKAESGSVILFKASRGIQLEKSIEEFQANEN
jgi:UDP-N-acetylmuramoyl-tripeptide--D-alanyl-D-alanine ligase